MNYLLSNYLDLGYLAVGKRESVGAPFGRDHESSNKEGTSLTVQSSSLFCNNNKNGKFSMATTE